MFHLKDHAGKPSYRAGTVATLVAVSITLLLGVVAVSVDGGLLQDNKRRVQNAADSAALAASNAIFANYNVLVTTGTADPSGKGAAAAKKSATDNGFAHNDADVKVVVNIPPKSGPFTDKLGYAEVIITYEQPRYFSTIWGTSATPVVARAVAKAYWGPAGNGVIVLDASVKQALDASGSGSVTVTGNAAMIVNSNHVDAAGRVTGGGRLTAARFDIYGGATGTFDGPVNTGVLPIPDPLRSLPQPVKPAAGTMTTTNLAGNKTYYLTSGSYSNLPNFGNGDTIILQQGGIIYLDGGGFNSTNGATIKMDPLTTGGVMIYNAPTGTQQNQGLNISGGSVTLSPPTSGPYAGMMFFQERSSPVSMSLQGQGGFDIKGTFYAANAHLNVTGQGVNHIGSQYISRTLSLSGGGDTYIDYSVEGTARVREVRLVE